MRQEREQAKAEAHRKAVSDSVRQGLKDKLSAAKLDVNDFFTNLAVKDLEIPDDDTPLSDLVGKAETLYNKYVKEANAEPGKPRIGGGGINSDEVDKHLWDDVASIVGRNRPKQ